MIIDASIGVKWLVPENDHERATALVREGELRVPRLFFSEVGNALIKKSRRGEIVLRDVEPSFVVLPQLVVAVDETGCMPRALELAMKLQHSFYDCVYLALAESLDDELVTADLKFIAKVDAAGEAGRVRRWARH